MQKTKPITMYAKKWPRQLFNCRDGRRLVVKQIDMLSEPGVYVLYKDDEPYYVGKAKMLRRRLRVHANRPTDRYYDFWSSFSFFVVNDPTIRSQLEGALIAAMPTANGARPKFKKAKLPPYLSRLLHEIDNPPIPVKSKAA
jgi:hypothetical protein